MNKKDNNDGLSQKDKVMGIVGLVFIIILVIIVRLSPVKENSNNIDNSGNNSNDDVVENNNNDNNSEDKDNNNKEDNYFLKIDNKNYNYTFTVYINGKKEILTGSVYQDKNKFTLISNITEKYLIVSDNLLKWENNGYKNIDNIRDYLKYISIDNLKSILDITVGVNNENIISYDVSVFDLLDKYEDIDYNSFEEIEDDSIKITLEDNYIKVIEIDYTNYYKYVNKDNTELRFKLEFNDYGKVEDFDI